MKFSTIFLVLLLAGCSNLGDKEKKLAQCEINATSLPGKNFRRDFVSGSPQSADLDLEAYNAFLLTCMEEKGFKYVSLVGYDGNINGICWAKNSSGMLPPWLPTANGAACFSQ